MEAGVDINTQSVNVSIRYISGKCEQNILNRYIDSKHHGDKTKYELKCALSKNNQQIAINVSNVIRIQIICS